MVKIFVRLSSHSSFFNLEHLIQILFCFVLHISFLVWNITTSPRGSLLLAALAFLFNVGECQSRIYKPRANSLIDFSTNLLVFQNFIKILYTDTSKTQRNSGHFGNEAKPSWLSLTKNEDD